MSRVTDMSLIVEHWASIVEAERAAKYRIPRRISLDDPPEVLAAIMVADQIELGKAGLPRFQAVPGRGQLFADPRQPPVPVQFARLWGHKWAG